MIVDLAKYNISSLNYSFRKEWSLTVFFFLNFIISFRVFNHSLLHGFGKIVETIFLPLIALFIVFRGLNRIVRNDYRMNGFHIMYGIYLLLPILPALSSQIVWDQPFYLGFIAFRQFYLIGGALLIYTYIIDNPRGLLVIERAMMLTAWFALILFFLTSTFADPKQFLDSRVVSYSANRGGILIFKFNMGFIFYGCVYHFVKYFKTKQVWHILISMTFLAYIVLERQDRSSMIAVLAAIGLYFILQVNIKRQILYVVGAIIPLLSLFVIYNHFNPEFFQGYVNMFQDIGYAITGEANPDVGQSVRIYETQIARGHISESPILGNGKLSNAFIEGGWSGLYVYFFPSDIGLIGSVFTYGFPGAVALYSQFVFALVWIRKVKYFRNNIFFQACCFYLLVLFIDSLSNGYLTVFAAQSLSTVTIIYLFYIFDKKVIREIGNIELNA